METKTFSPEQIAFDLPKELIGNTPRATDYFRECKLILFEKKTGRITDYPIVELPDILDDQLCYANNAFLDKDCVHLGRFQCIWAREKQKDGKGTFAVPSAGLPIDDEMRSRMNIKFLSLFTPMEGRLNQDEQYRTGKSMKEPYRIPEPPENPVIAIGTTSVKALESYAVTKEQEGISELLILPGHEFKLVHGLLTNFHYPKEPLSALVSAFTGVEEYKEIIKYALEFKVRFVDFGDRLLVI